MSAMTQTPWETLAMILAIAAATQLTRWLPFWLFPENRKVPPVVSYLGSALPPAVMGLLVVYCLKGVDFVAPPHAIPEAVAIGCIIILHTWKRNVLLSIGGGTVVYMLLLRVFFGT